ncbi:DUF397 domain-containing protein [Actinomadura monticuli]|uniref:DUF397 domain-containing protein n=1 Tax=Actinomadura monticuli TaxID=3097367 RepID=A0ABV4QL91_9ACTN
MNPPVPTWRKSSYSQGGGTECVEVAEAGDGCVVRDSRNPDGPLITFSPSAWAALLHSIKAGAHDLR